MIPTPNSFRLSRLLLTLASAALQHVPSHSNTTRTHTYAKRDLSHSKTIAFGCLIPILVILSGIFAGLTLGYMSLDETQLNVLSISGTPKQKLYASKIKPIRKNGHFLLVTLLLANMVVNETLPVIADPVLGGGVQSVVVSTVLIVIFSEIIPQSLCTRYGMYFGAKMAGPVRALMWLLCPVAYPVAKLLELVLGPHHGIIYRRTELKELIAMHSSMGELGGDLKTDTVTIIGGALDLQEKVVKQAMTPIENVFMLSIDTRLDYETLRKICLTGHSRVPVYEEIEIPAPTLVAGVATGKDLAGSQMDMAGGSSTKTVRVKKIVGILLVKQCVLLDPNDATPLRKIPLNKVPLVPHNEPLLGILDKFQEGRSHMAIVSRFSVARAASVKHAVKHGLTHRLRQAIKDSDSETESSEDEDEDKGEASHSKKWTHHMRRKRSDRGEESSENGETLRESTHDDGSDDAASRSSSERPKKMRAFSRRGRRKNKSRKPGDVDLEMGMVEHEQAEESKIKMPTLTLPRAGFWGNEQDVPADAVLSTEGAEEFLQSMDPAVLPLGIITLEDVLEELIGEEIYDEFDPQGHPDLSSYAGRETKAKLKLPGGTPLRRRRSAPQLAPHSDGIASPIPSATGLSSTTTVSATSDAMLVASSSSVKPLAPLQIVRPTAMPALPLRGFNVLTLKGLGSMIARSRSAPPIPGDMEGGGGEHNGEKGESTPTVMEGVVMATAPSAGPGSPDIEDEHSGDAKQLGSPSLANVYPVEADNMSMPSPLPQVVHAERSRRTRLTAPHSPTIVSVTPVPAVPPSISAASKPNSRSSSPSPSLEQAILIERKRRAASAGAGSMPAPKGLRFKSSPLTGERNGVVVAERVWSEKSVEGEVQGSKKDIKYHDHDTDEEKE